MTEHSNDSAVRPGEENVPYYQRLANNYDLFFSDLDRNMSEEGEWLARVLHDHGAHAVLDASCGAGRQAIPLAQRGFTLTGADPSAAMLREASAVMAREGVDFPLHECGFADLPARLEQQFDAVIALGNGLCNLATCDEILDALRAMRAVCRHGGICLVGIKDFAVVRARNERFHGHRIAGEHGDRRILFEVWDFEGSHLVSTAFLLQESRDHSETIWRTDSATTREYMLGADELRDLAGQAGFDRFMRLDHPSEAVFLLS